MNYSLHELIGYIEINKNNPNFKYTLYSSSVYANYPKENALIYGSNLRFSSTVDKTNEYWAICFPDIQIRIKYYKFQEPDYGPGNRQSHQKSWIFYGSKSNDNSNYIPIDSR